MTAPRALRVLVVDDSPTARMLLVRTLESQPDIKVVAQAKDGAEAVALTKELKPDVITMDVRMPNMDGLRATEQIMGQFPTPIVIVSSSVEAPDLQITFNALRVGALEVVEKPRVMDDSNFEKIRRELVEIVRAMSEVRVVRRRHVVPVTVPAAKPGKRTHHLVAIGASTGGPQLLGEILSKINGSFPTPILVVQHMAPGFTEGFVRWLHGETRLQVKLAEEGDALLPGTVYVAPDKRHMRITDRWRVALGDDPPIGQFRPAVDALFESVATAVGMGAVGVLLTGMGHDGAKGLKAMRSAGAHTLAQDAESCVVPGMPDSARELDAVEATVTPGEIPGVLAALTQRP